MTAADHDGLYLPGDVAPLSHDVAEPAAKKSTWSDVPWRTIVATVGVVVVTYGVLMLLIAAVRILVWISVAGFLAIVLAQLWSPQQPIGRAHALAPAPSSSRLTCGRLALFACRSRPS